MKLKDKIVKNAGCFFSAFMLGFLSIAGFSGTADANKPAVLPVLKIKADKAVINMGRSVEITAQADFPDGKPASDYLILTYVNGRRWGAHEFTDKSGTAKIIFPLPNTGPMEIQAEIRENKIDQKDRAYLFVGYRMPKNAHISNKISVNVQWREMPAWKSDPGHLIGMQWEPWFTPQAAFWQTAQAVPAVGFYDSYNRDVMRQHVLWFMDLGVDFLLFDWSNHIWGLEHWNDRHPNTNTIIHASELMLETLADMRAEGFRVPKAVIMPGYTNGPPAAMSALNEQLDWIYQTYLRNPRFEGLFQDYDGKPLIVILDTAALAHKDGTAGSAFKIPFVQQTLGTSAENLDKQRTENKTPVDDSHFTVRWMSTQLQTTKHDELGYWTWMDGVIRPIVTYRDGKAEAVTVTPSFFAEHGWKGPEAFGRRGGTTYIETFKAALETKPRVLFIHQFNEFAGQPDGSGYGPNKDIYVDSYNVELSDDLEPVSITAPAYRGNGGWGYYYLNLTRALLDIYRQESPKTTVMAIGSPLLNETVRSDDLRVSWAWAGKTPTSFSVLVNGEIAAQNIKGTEAVINLKKVKDGPVKLTVNAEGAVSDYTLSYNGDDILSGKMVPASAETEFIIKRGE